eukprot:TRINITY_DN35003_c0_g1_i11.p1 TRINITY_DN35003_c0_g1~~TRINITY_DN35003_c0_g1_i11.p1  ORF type:complete len:264 (+),score=28.49 TRINITY_DN35003_c0_g1_i11:107-898(+)
MQSLLAEACAWAAASPSSRGLTYSSAQLASLLKEEWLYSVAALRKLSDEGWSSLDLPIPLEEALRFLLLEGSPPAGGKQAAAHPQLCDYAQPRREVVTDRSTLPARRRVVASGPPADVNLRGLDSELLGIISRKFARCPPASGSTTQVVKTSTFEPLEAFRKRGYACFLSFLRIFQDLPPMLGRRELQVALSKVREHGLQDADIASLVDALRPLPAPTWTLFERLWPWTMVSIDEDDVRHVRFCQQRHWQPASMDAWQNPKPC